MVGMKVLVTAGPTREYIDPVRFITNHSTGKMGYAIAENCMRRGADVTLVTGPTSIKKPDFVKVIDIISADDMFNAVKDNMENMDIIIKAAAVADFTPQAYVDEKIKKENKADIGISLKKTTDILSYLGEHKKANQFICGFAMETQNVIDNARGKLIRKHADMIVANSLKQEGAGFGVDTNIVTIITKDGEEQLPIMSKEKVASVIIDNILTLRNS